MSCMAGPSGGEEEKFTGYCYSIAPSTHMMSHHHLQSSSFESNNPEIYNNNMEMIGFSPKNLQNDTNANTNLVVWKGFFNKHGPTSSSTSSKEPTTSTDFYHQQQHQQHDSLFVNEEEYPLSLRSCVFTCEGNERPSQGLSLSLSSSTPSTIGLQSFALRHHQHDDMRFLSRPHATPPANVQQQDMMIQQWQFQMIRNSKYLIPAQELLNEFCNLGTKQNESTSKVKVDNKSNEDEENAIKKQSLYSLDLLELQKRKTKLLQMLEEVDRRYKHYCDQMKTVVSSFEAVAGDGAARVYSALASKAMSRHFRCLRDGIVGQIKATKKAMGEKDTAAPGTTRGETPRLRLIDQTLRQQRAFQQMTMMENHPWRPQRGLPERSVSVLRAWLFEHFLHPYPSDVDKHILARQTGLSRSQVSNWFINARVRLWKPMVEEMYLEELKEQENVGSLDGAILKNGNSIDQEIGGDHPHHRTQTHNNEDQKPTPDQIIRIDPESLSSVIINTSTNDNGKRNQNVHGIGEDHNNPSFGHVMMELDFSSHQYNQQHHHHQSGEGTSGVSLTLGLHQHGGNGGVSLAFSPSAAQSSSLFYPRDHHQQIEDCQQVQYSSLLDSETQNLPYRNLMGAQLLHDLAG